MKNCFNLSKNADLKEAAANLYKTFRKIKKLGYKKIYVVKIPNFGPGIAINDRLKRLLINYMHIEVKNLTKNLKTTLLLIRLIFISKK